MKWLLSTSIRSIQGAAAALACGMLALAAATPARAVDQAVLDEGRTLFQTAAVPACAVCHTLRDADAAGAIGPDLDDLQPNRDQILAVLRDGSGAMPSFSDSLSEEQRQVIADYVIWATQPH